MILKTPWGKVVFIKPVDIVVEENQNQEHSPNFFPHAWKPSLLENK
jgi:hypothetical protein